MQLITSTSNLEEMHSLLDRSLDRIGLSQSTLTAEFLLDHLKALSGRLAIRLTGQDIPSAELVALAASRALCLQERASDRGECWTSLDDGFLVPADDVHELLPPLDTTKRKTGLLSGLIHVSVTPPRGKLRFRFIEVKHRRHLRAGRDPTVLRDVREQVETLRKSWNKWYSTRNPRSFRALRRAKLARVLRFYADKARRHHLSEERHRVITSEIDRMLAEGSSYDFREAERDDRCWIFCPEYAGTRPTEISPADWKVRIFLFGPDLLPDPSGQLPAVEQTPERVVNGSAELVQAPPPAPTDESEPSPSLDGGVRSPGTENMAPNLLLGHAGSTGAEARWPLTVKGNPHLLVAGLPGMEDHLAIEPLPANGRGRRSADRVLLPSGY